MAGLFHTCGGWNSNSVVLMLLFAATLMSGIELREAATCSKLLDTYDTSAGVYTNGSAIIPYSTPVTQEVCLAWCTESCLCVGYAFFSATLTAINTNCLAYVSLVGESIQESKATMYKRQGAPTCSNPPNTYESSSGVLDSSSSGISIPVSDDASCKDLCSSSCLCFGYAFDVDPSTSINCLLYRELSGNTTTDSSVTLYKRQGLSTSAGSGNSIAKMGGISGGFFNLLLIGGGLFLSIYFTN